MFYWCPQESFMKFKLIILVLMTLGCTKMEYSQTVEKVEIDKYMGKWYVIAGRFTFFEKGQHNSIENYTWNENKKRIDIEYFYNKDSFNGKIKKIPQKAWVHNRDSNAHWKVSPLWPFKLDYLIIDLAPDYSWTAIGVPSQNYLWIMARDWKVSNEQLEQIISNIKNKGYNTDAIEIVPQQW